MSRAGVAVSTPWPITSGRGDRGVEHTHNAQADLDAYDDLRAPNAKIKIEGVAYSIVSAHRHDFLPHVDLELKIVRGA